MVVTPSKPSMGQCCPPGWQNMFEIAGPVAQWACFALRHSPFHEISWRIGIFHDIFLLTTSSQLTHAPLGFITIGLVILFSSSIALNSSPIIMCLSLQSVPFHRSSPYYNRVRDHYYKSSPQGLYEVDGLCALNSWLYIPFSAILQHNSSYPWNNIFILLEA